MSENFSKLFEIIKDGRRELSVEYPAKFLFLGSLLAVLSGCFNFKAIHDFF